MKTSDSLVSLIPGVYYIPGITNVGVICDSTDICNLIYLIDTGKNSYIGQSILRIIHNYFSERNLNYKIEAIINTHTHSDHCGANPEVQKLTGCQIWTSKQEACFTSIANLHGEIIWGGNLLDDLEYHFNLEETFAVNKYVSEEDIIGLTNGDTISFLDLSGHSYKDLGIVYTSCQGEKVLFAGDAMFTPSPAGKHIIHFMLHPGAFVKSLEKIKAMEELKYCIPSHGKLIDGNIPEAVDFCINTIEKTKNDILLCLEEKPASTEAILKEVTLKNDIYMNITLYSLLKCTIQAFLSELNNKKFISTDIIENELFWKIEK